MKIKTTNIFFEVPCLTLRSHIKKEKLKEIIEDKRYPAQSIQKFITNNEKLFEFLGVQPFMEGDKEINLYFNTSNYIGSIPLKSTNGTQIGDFIVTPRYESKSKNIFDELSEILNLLQNEIEIEQIDSLPLISGNYFKPPLYLEAIKFIELLEKLIKSHWRKFDSVSKIVNEPKGVVNWTKYIENEYKVENRLKFITKTNILSELHKEYFEIRYVFDICKQEILSPKTPNKIKANYEEKIYFLERKLYSHQSLKTDKIKIRQSDSNIVKACKEQANKILNNNFSNNTAWRVDMSNLFEKFIQHIFKVVTSEIGGKLHSNFKFNSNFKLNYPWALNHLEPDAIFQKEETLIFIDAKYKSHLLNMSEPILNETSTLKDTFRHDLHQILAYSSFDTNKNKFNILCYPTTNNVFSKHLEHLEFYNPLNGSKNSVFLLGIPFNKSFIKEASEAIKDILNKIFSKSNNLPIL